MVGEIAEQRVHLRDGRAVDQVAPVALDFGQLIGGLIITENIFNYPGMGQYFVRAANDGDFPKLMPFMVLVIVSVLLFNLIADVAYAYLDPRIRLD